MSSARVGRSLSPRPSLFGPGGWLAFCWIERERNHARSLFPIGIRGDDMMYRNLSLCSSIDSNKTRRRRPRKRSREMPTRRTKHKEKEKKRDRERQREKKNAPEYCSTSDFTHPFNPSSNVSKNAAPSKCCCSRAAFADANAATVVAHAIVFFKQ